MAGGYSAPGVYKREIDLSEILVAQGVSNGGTVIRALKGPVKRPVLVTNDKNFIETFGEPYYVSGLDDKIPTQAAIGGHLVPELGYGSYGAIEFLKESDTLYVVRAFDQGDIYSTVELTSSAVQCTTCDTSAGIPVSESPIEVFDTRDRISTYEEYYRDGGMIGDGPLLVGFVGPGEDGNNFAVTVETISPTAEWLYSYDNYPTETSATQALYGNDVAEVWIDGSLTDTYTTDGDVTLIVSSGASVPVGTFQYIPVGVSKLIDGQPGMWEMYRGAMEDTTSDEELIEGLLHYTPVDGVSITDWTTSVDISVVTESPYVTSAVWTVGGTYNDIPASDATSGTFGSFGVMSATPDVMRGSPVQVKGHFRIASEIVKISVFKKPNNRSWDDLYANASDRDQDKLRIEPLEVFYGTMKPFTDDDRNELFIEKSVNGNSDFIYVKADGSFNDYSSWDYDSGFLAESLNVPNGIDTAGFYVLNTDRLAKLQGGYAQMSTGLYGDDAEFWQYFENREELPVQIIINPSFNNIDKQAVGELCNFRRDCIATNQVAPVTLVDTQDIINSEIYGYPAPSFMALYAGYSKVYDNYNDKFVYLPNSLFAGPVYARVDTFTEPWFAPAGVARATLSVLDQNKIFNMTSIGNMYNRNINAIKLVQGAGFAIWGQKTAQLKTSALDRINVRRNLIYIQTNIERVLNNFVFENNTDQTRLRIFSVIDEFLAGIRAGDGLYTYDVVCDETNNPPSVIDANQLNVDIYVQPVKTVEFIQFTTVVTRTGVSFSDVRLKYA